MPHPFADIGTCIVQELGANSAITVRRYGGGAWSTVTGRREGETFFDTPTSAVVQPSTPREVEKLPENERTKSAITVWTQKQLLTSSVSTQGRADEILWDGKTYQVILSEDWTTQAGYSLSIATRLGS